MGVWSTRFYYLVKSYQFQIISNWKGHKFIAANFPECTFIERLLWLQIKTAPRLAGIIYREVYSPTKITAERFTWQRRMRSHFHIVNECFIDECLVEFTNRLRSLTIFHFPQDLMELP